MLKTAVLIAAAGVGGFALAALAVGFGLGLAAGVWAAGLAAEGAGWRSDGSASPPAGE